MNYLAELPISSDALGLITAGLIFIVTVVLIAKKLISFLITVVLLFFAIASGMAIANNDIVREYFSKEKLPNSTQNDENFFEPLKDEAIHLLNRIVDLLHTERAPRIPQEERAKSLPDEKTRGLQEGRTNFNQAESTGLQTKRFGPNSRIISAQDDRYDR